MDDFAVRICRPVAEGWREVEAGRATLMDLSRVVGQASAALDNQYAPLPDLLRRAERDLEYAHFSTEQDAAVEVGRNIMAPLLGRLPN
jgi:hypothetical protein